MKILVAIDGSENSLRAAEYAAKLKESHPGNDITLFTVACYGEPMAMSESFVTYEDFTKACLISNKAKVDRAKEIFDSKGLAVNTDVIAGDPADVILEYANKNGFDKIIMGSRGLGSFKGMLLGSVSHKVLNLAKVPVTIIK
ncbi:MAG: universal stress protein [Bacillota bacterium]|jgi:nucleotide-binding universal stress UspA family protein